MYRYNTRQYQALLLDLDGTILNLDIENFIPAYLEVLSEKYTGNLNRDVFIRHLLESTARMVANNEPDRKNIEVFYDEFCQRIGQSREQIHSILEDFYQNDFPALSSWGGKHPYARELLENARQNNMILVLATNPIFPLTAIVQRLGWGGFSPEEFDFITSIENMHFCKPNPAYYKEIISRINCSPQQCLMAGNDTLEDLSAAKAGLDTFLVEDLILQRGDQNPAYTYRGKLKDLAFFIKGLEAFRY